MRPIASGNVKPDWPHRAHEIWPQLPKGARRCGRAEPVALGAGLDDVGIEGEPVGDGSHWAQAVTSPRDKTIGVT